MYDTVSVHEIDEVFGQLDSLLRKHPDLIKRMKPKWKALEQTATNTNRIAKLQKLCPTFVSSSLQELNTQQSAPFVTLLIGLYERKYMVSQMSMMMMWRRLVASGQENIISYFSWKRMEETFFSKIVLAQDILRVCTDNETLLNNINAALADDKCVDFKIRELLGGISMAADVKKAWKEWALRNHPDKGGDTETFLRVKLVYEEWCEIHKLNNNQSE
mgnify:CR=1 FL=1